MVRRLPSLREAVSFPFKLVILILRIMQAVMSPMACKISRCRQARCDGCQVPCREGAVRDLPRE